jgi:hypothetical protein
MCGVWCVVCGVLCCVTVLSAIESKIVVKEGSSY